MKEDLRNKEEKLEAASYMDQLLMKRLESGETRNDLPITLLKKDIPDKYKKFFLRNEDK